jgi:hypothetical protein
MQPDPSDEDEITARIPDFARALARSMHPVALPLGRPETPDAPMALPLVAKKPSPPSAGKVSISSGVVKVGEARFKGSSAVVETAARARRSRRPTCARGSARSRHTRASANAKSRRRRLELRKLGSGRRLARSGGRSSPPPSCCSPCSPSRPTYLRAPGTPETRAMADAESSPLAFTYVAVKAKVQANAQAPLHAAKTSAPRARRACRRASRGPMRGRHHPHAAVLTSRSRVRAVHMVASRPP